MTEPVHDPAEAKRHPDAPLFTAETLPAEVGPVRLYRKALPVRAVRVPGPFRVETSESENEPFLCEDGYLAWDARGYPYAIAADEFALIYVEVSGKLAEVDGKAEPTPAESYEAFCEELDHQVAEIKREKARSIGLDPHGDPGPIPGQITLEEEAK